MDKDTIVSYFRNQATSGNWASLYDPNNIVSYPFIQRFVKTVALMHPIEGEVLDMGCGTGILVKVVVEAKANYTGFDLAPEMIDACAVKFKQEIEAKKATFILADSSNFNPSKKYHQAIGMGYIEYFENPDFGMLQAKQWLSNNGKLILSFPHKNSIDYFAVNASFPLRALMTLVTGKKTVKPDRKMWSQKEAIALFQKHGFQNIKIVNYNINLFHYPFNKVAPKFCNWFGSLIEHSMLGKLSILSTSFIISAKK